LIHSRAGLGGPMDRPGYLASEAGENLGEGGPDSGIKNPDELEVGAGGIEEWAEEIKNTAPSLFGKSCPDRGDRLEGGMVERGEKKTRADLVETATEVSRRQVDPDTERFEDIGSATFGGDPAVAVLDDSNTAGGEDKSARRRDVE